MFTISKRSYAFLGALLSFSIVGLAFYIEAHRHLLPCSLCYIQRAIFGALGIVFFLEWLHDPKRFGQAIYTLVLTVFSMLGIGTATYHLWLQYRPKGTTAESCGASLEYLIHNYPVLDALRMFTKAPGDCSKIEIFMMGLSFPAWALIGFVVLLLITLKSFTKVR